MKITFLGHAGLYIETQFGSLLCDPWFTPAYMGSWFPFPDNDQVDKQLLGNQLTYLYISHLHQDHFDATFLLKNVRKGVPVILPATPLPLLERALRELGFTHFIQTHNGQWVNLNRLKIMTLSMVSPSDGPLGDSALIVDDGETRIFNQNDARPRDLTIIREMGSIDAHFLQFSGAIWYPMVYDYPDKMKVALGRKKRENEMARALQYIKQINAKYIFPSAGPACFLDNHLFAYNDVHNDPTNTFPDQTVFLDYLLVNGVENGRLVIPNSTIQLGREGHCVVKHLYPESVIRRSIFQDKQSYLEAYKQRRKIQINSIIDALPHHQIDILPALQAWFEPLLAKANLICQGINGRLLLDCNDSQICIDFLTRKVYDGDPQLDWTYAFHFDRSLVEHCILSHCEDWVNELFLSFRFQSQRKGTYNEYLYTFFKCLSLERLDYAENYYARKQAEMLTFERHGYRVQQLCPHAGADLSHFAVFDLEQKTVTCQLHGWQFDLETGRCMNSETVQLYVQLLKSEAPGCGSPRRKNSSKDESIRIAELSTESKKCSHCWYHPSDINNS